MACSSKTYLLITLFIFVTSITGNYNLPKATNGRIQSKPGKGCLIYHWNAVNNNQPCVNPDCNITLTLRLFKGSVSNITEMKHYLLSKQVKQDNSSSSYSECLYDSSKGETASCCENIIPKVNNITSAHQVSFSDYEKITLAVTLCVRGASCYDQSTGPQMKILPWRDPCFIHKPCQRRGFAVCHPSVDDYRCSCQYRWTGKNCDVQKNMTALTYKAGECLNSSVETDVQFLQGKTVDECRAVCLETKCKSFEFRIMPSSLHGNCTLYDTNSLEHRVMSCDADLYELKSFLTSTTGDTNSTAITPTKKPGISTVVVVILAIIVLLVIVPLLVVLIAKPFHTSSTPTRSHSNLGALPLGTRPGNQETAPLAVTDELMV